MFHATEVTGSQELPGYTKWASVGIEINKIVLGREFLVYMVLPYDSKGGVRVCLSSRGEGL